MMMVTCCYKLKLVYLFIIIIISGGSRGGRIGRGPPPPLLSADFSFFGLFWPIFGRGIEEFGFPPPPPPFSQILSATDYY